MEESAHKAGSDRLAVADQELLHGRWSAAKGTFESILADSPDHPRALDGLGLALFWLGDSRRAREARESAYVAHRRRGDARGAAAAALFVAVDYRLSEGNTAAWGGWLARAERCLEGSGPCAEGGETLVERAKTTGDPLRAERLAREALDLARELDEPNLETSALSQVGMALVRRGRWEEGMGLLDEAMAIATGGEATDARAIGDTCCQTLAACDQLADLERASQWCRVVIDFAERRNYTPIYAWCRAIYAGVLTLGGDWDRADRELAQALRIYEQFGGIGSRMLALARLADLRYREGRVEEAERLLAGCEDHPLAVPVVARLRLLRRELDAASEMLERALAALPDETAACAPLLPVLVDVELARGRPEAAAAAAQRLATIGDRLGRENLSALAELAAAKVALGCGDGPAPLAEGALEVFLRLGMPFEEGEARLVLARVRASEGSPLAADEARRALQAFERLGAARRADEAAALLRSLGEAGRTPLAVEGELTAREWEVLELLAEGLANAEIAERLVISEKTAGHHASRIFRKLGLRNRAEAAAYALRARGDGT